MSTTVSVEEGIRAILENYPNAGRDSLIPILQEIQEKQGYLSREAVVLVGDFLKLPTSKIYGVATFYNQFRFTPQGKYHIQICRGTACHVKGSAAVLEALKRELKVAPGETTRDGLFSLEIVACIGACGLAPVMNISGNFHANLTTQKIPEIIKSYRKAAE
ncbi:MAG: NADH-quinone oxidoreductase subunit NuoE [Planctomycetia bacterium]|nr:NADH-quinone oxidoreductase subunit NuoE [Planctomycetia bacterium]